MQSVLSYRRTIRGVSPEEARKELRRIERGEEELRTGKPSTVYKRGWYQIKPLAQKTIYTRSHTRKGISIRAYTRTYTKWKPEHKEFIRQRKHMNSKDLMNAFNLKFGTSRGYHEIRTMQRRV